jgi:hypothetical protein
MEKDDGIILTGENRRNGRKTCPSATLSTTNPTWNGPGANPGLRGEGPANNRLSYGMASIKTTKRLTHTYPWNSTITCSVPLPIFSYSFLFFFFFFFIAATALSDQDRPNTGSPHNSTSCLHFLLAFAAVFRSLSTSSSHLVGGLITLVIPLNELN